MRKNTARVLRAWSHGKADKRDAAIWTDGRNVYSYGTCIAAPLSTSPLGPFEVVVLNATKYSVTTTIHQNGVREYLRGAYVVEVDGLPLGVRYFDLIEAANVKTGRAA